MSASTIQQVLTLPPSHFFPWSLGLSIYVFFKLLNVFLSHSGFVAKLSSVRFGVLQGDQRQGKLGSFKFLLFIRENQEISSFIYKSRERHEETIVQ